RHDLLRLIRGGTGAGESALAARDRFARRADLRARRQRRAGQRRARLFDRRLALRLQRRLHAAAEDRDVRLQQKAPAVGGQKKLRRIRRRRLEERVYRRPPVLGAVAQHVLRRLLLTREQLEVGPQQSRWAGSFWTWLRLVRRYGEGRIVNRVRGFI